jgi:hypothetical protein
LLTLTPGQNLLVAGTSVGDPDLLRIQVPAGRTLNAIVLAFHEGPNQVFVGMQPGSTWTAGVGNEIDPDELMGWTEFPYDPETHHTEDDILDDISLAKYPDGFTPPLASGDYTLLFQAPNTVIPFALHFIVSGAGPSPPGDFNGDAVVNGADLARWRTNVGVNAAADADGDLDSDGADFLVWQRNVSPPSALPFTAAVPEPAAYWLVTTGLIGLLARRRIAAFRGA